MGVKDNALPAPAFFVGAGVAIRERGGVVRVDAVHFGWGVQESCSMSPRRSSLSLNQKLTLLIALLAIITTMIAAFISGHDWFPSASSISVPITDTVSQSPTQTLIPTPIDTSTLSPPVTPVPDETGQIAIVEVQSSSGSTSRADSEYCLWIDASGQGATIELTLEHESIIDTLRVQLYGNFVRRISLTFSDRSQQTKDLIVTRDYEYQEVVLEPVRTLSITIEVLEVQDNFASNFGICHIEVFGSQQ
jgi:hypothetical protein